MTPEAARMAEQWGFVPTEELPGGYCSHVYANLTHVLKVPFRGEEMTTGRLAAERMSGQGGVHVLRSDVATGALLMERLGGDLSESTLEEEARIDVFISLARQLRNLPTEGLWEIEDYFPESELRNKLLASTNERCFLHGDLHHYNILRGSKDWLAIDPKGLVGDPAIEGAAFLGNPAGRLQDIDDLTGLLRLRITRISEGLELDPWRVWAWGKVRAEDDEEPYDAESLRFQAAMKELESEFASFQ